MSENKLQNVSKGAVISEKDVRESVKQERKWLKENNAVSAVNDGPVEDLEGVPIPADLLYVTPESVADRNKN